MDTLRAFTYYFLCVIHFICKFCFFIRDKIEQFKCEYESKVANVEDTKGVKKKVKLKKWFIFPLLRNKKTNLR